jgi:hypothetical protein
MELGPDKLINNEVVTVCDDCGAVEQVKYK